ncbi:hypothetical protein Pint_24030 [Pistacia integerrima]|uniref:Uncharacterized protein n=1 Tax=Pistacia integerrima TaxID=434235 RepID=A0ACC0YLQ6_9ROSI|nr:hypothetical protein Pint_24030 [Pistacia integerrima]
MVESKLMVNASEDADVIAPSPAMATGLAFASSASVAIVGTCLMFYVLGVLIKY